MDEPLLLLVGLDRLGHFFASKDVFGIEPDMTTMAKIVAGWVTAIDYGNFKGKTYAVDDELADLYGEVWALGYEYQRAAE